MAEHRHQRHDARATADQEQRATEAHIPDEISADRSADLELVTRHQHVVQVGRNFTIRDAFDRQLDLSHPFGRGGNGVAALRLIAVRRCQADVVVLPRPVGHPFWQRECEALRLPGFGTDGGNRPGLPLEHRLHRDQSPLYRSSFQGSPWRW